MSGEAVRKAWIVAASIGAVEALKDQGVARWNGPIMELQQHAKTKIVGSYCSRWVKYCSTSSVGGYNYNYNYKVMRRSEESMKKVMDVSCFGPNTIRF
ncbi:hypothetical protein QVD17_27198 [Tagetes erecta]|uniref:Uncharacterized protein n=1 Tax=Tagetes erecta TaxID=13708 RepID=A0AAD8KEC9_TARER|nr:hypothetical protein QVD17_27198 [Tagetes erecta]